eukprot:jgi/Botrbrau1/21793/Bobra.0190s0018.1
MDVWGCDVVQEVGMAWAQQQREEQPDLQYFRLGFHAVPTLRRIHLHVISQDLGLVKHKRHWNSFTTAAFLDIREVEEALLAEGRVSEAHLTTGRQQLAGPSACSNCHAPLVGKALWEHYSSCGPPPPAAHQCTV